MRNSLKHTSHLAALLSTPVPVLSPRPSILQASPVPFCWLLCPTAVATHLSRRSLPRHPLHLRRLLHLQANGVHFRLMA